MKKLPLLAFALFLTSPVYAQVSLGTSTSATNPQASGDATTGLFSPTTDAVSISSGGTEIMRVNGSGVGIGTGSIAQLLTMVGATNPTLQIGVDETNRYGGIQYVTSLDTLLIQGGVYGGTTRPIIIQSGGGNVGIGTTSPSKILSLGGTAAQTFWMERGTAAGNNLTVQAGGGLSGGSNENGGNLILSPGITTGTGTSNIQFQTYPAGSSGTSDNSPVTAMTIASTGDVGIGTSSPASTLDIVGQAHITYSSFPVITIERITGNTNTTVTTENIVAHTTGTVANGFGPVLGFFVEDSTGSADLADIGVRRDGSTMVGDMVFDTYVSGSETERMRILNNGNVGIATTSPSYTLHVNGSVAGTSAYNNLSDIRMKKDVQPITYGLDAVMALRPVGFNWKLQDQEWKKQHQIGLVAQEVETVVPEVVTTADDKMQSKSIAYGSLVPVLIKAIQEQQHQIDDLKQTIDQLKQKKY